jgi:hypothetical protein
MQLGNSPQIDATPWGTGEGTKERELFREYPIANAWLQSGGLVNGIYPLIAINAAKRMAIPPTPRIRNIVKTRNSKTSPLADS